MYVWGMAAILKLAKIKQSWLTHPVYCLKIFGKNYAFTSFKNTLLFSNKCSWIVSIFPLCFNILCSYLLTSTRYSITRNISNARPKRKHTHLRAPKSPAVSPCGYDVLGFLPAATCTGSYNRMGTINVKINLRRAIAIDDWRYFLSREAGFGDRFGWHKCCASGAQSKWVTTS